MDGIFHGGCVRDNSFLRHFVLNPSSYRRMVWCLIGALCVLVDLVMMPLWVFPLSEETSTVLSRTNDIMFFYWVLDVPLQFLIGIDVKGIIDMRPKRIAWNYIRSWFCLDMTIIAIDVLVLTLTRNGSKGGM